MIINTFYKRDRNHAAEILEMMAADAERTAKIRKGDADDDPIMLMVVQIRQSGFTDGASYIKRVAGSIMAGKIFAHSLWWRINRIPIEFEAD